MNLTHTKGKELWLTCPTELPLAELRPETVTCKSVLSGEE